MQFECALCAELCRVFAVITAVQVSTRLPTRDKPVKYQVRVLVCCGVKDPEGERLDHHLPQKLRCVPYSVKSVSEHVGWNPDRYCAAASPSVGCFVVERSPLIVTIVARCVANPSRISAPFRVLCGRRKGNILLLGYPWSQDLDADGNGSCNPQVNPSCLVRTAQRALLAQALLKLPVQSHIDYQTGQVQYSCEGLVKLCDVHYHRPVEEIRGKTYPEQVGNNVCVCGFVCRQVAPFCIRTTSAAACTCFTGANYLALTVNA
jgi:hypothetical protein